MKYFIKTRMEGEFPSGFDVEEYEVSGDLYSQIMAILVLYGKDLNAI